MKIIPTRLVARISLSLSLALSLSLSSFIHPLRFLAPLSRALFLSRSLSSSHRTVEVTQNRAPGTGCLVPRCRYHEERMSIARSHSFREGETASADFTAFSYGAEKRATTLLLDRRSDPFDSYNSGFATRSARSIARANDSWPTFFIFFYFFLTSPTFSSIRFRSRRRPPPPRCRRFFGSALLETFDLEPLFLTPFIELTGISPCFCITLRR